MNTPAELPKPAPKPMIQSMKPSERLAELNRQIDAAMDGIPASEDEAQAAYRAARRAAAASLNEAERAEIKNLSRPARDKWMEARDARLDAAVKEAADRMNKLTLSAGGTIYKVNQTRERLQALKDEINKSPAFKDRPSAAKPGERATGGVTTKRAPKTVVQDFVADGDFENAQALADHYGIDIKAGMGAKQKRAYQDWQDSKAP